MCLTERYTTEITKGNQHNDLTCYLGTGNCTHSAHEAADENAGKTEKDADSEIDAEKPGCDQADRIDLSCDVGERCDDGGSDSNQTHRIFSVPPPSRATRKSGSMYWPNLLR